MNLSVTDSGQVEDICDRAIREQFLSLSEEADDRVNFVANLNKGLVSSEGHDQHRELNHRGLLELLMV